MAESSKKNEELLKEARERFKRCLDADRENQARALEAIKFRFGEQWPEAVKNARINDPNGARPCLTLDKTNQYVRQVVNDQRQNRPSIKVRPVDDQGDPDVAEIIQGLIRNIEEQSYADVAYDTAIEHAADGGYGYFRIITEYEDPASFDQCIRIKRIRNRFTAYLDPAIQTPEGSDAKYGFVTEVLPKDEAERKYGAERVKSWYEDILPGDKGEWCMEDGVRIAEYFCIKNQKKKLLLLSDGRAMLEDELAGMPEAEREALEVEDERDTEIPVTYWHKMSATEVLEETTFPASYIPILRVIGNEYDIEGKAQLTGMIDASAMDGQRMYNYAASAFVERVALEPTAPYIAADDQIDEYADDWKTANRRNLAVLKYKPVSADGHMVPPPQRNAMAGIPAGWMAVLQHMEHSIQAGLGMYAADVGDDGNEKSGRAILARQKAGDTATFHYIDNLSRAIRHAGRIIVEMVPHIYSRRKILRTIGEDGTPQSVKVDFEQQMPVRKFKDQQGAIQRIYNPGLGKYDVAAVAGPSFTTKRQEGAAVLTETVGRNPALMQIAGDLMFRALDVPYADELADRMKKMLPPQLQENPEDESLPPAAVAALRQRDMALAQAQQVIQELQPKAADNANSATKIQLDREKNQTDAAKVQLERDRLTQEVDVANQQLGQVMQGLGQVGQAVTQLTAAIGEAQTKNAEAIQAILEFSVQGRDGRMDGHGELLTELKGFGSQLVDAMRGVQQTIVDSHAARLQVVKNAMGETQSVEITPVRGEARSVDVSVAMSQ